MKLSHTVWGHPRRTGHGGKVWQNVVTGEGNGKPLQYSCLENPMNSMKRQKDRILKEELPSSAGAQYATGDQWRNNSRKNEGMEPKQKQHPVVDVTGDRSKVWCCKEQYCIGTWNVRSMNQGKLEVVKQEMARVNVNILGISELKWTGMGEFNSDDHYICYCGQESLRSLSYTHSYKQKTTTTLEWCRTAPSWGLMSSNSVSEDYLPIPPSLPIQSCLPPLSSLYSLYIVQHGTSTQVVILHISIGTSQVAQW